MWGGSRDPPRFRVAPTCPIPPGRPQRPSPPSPRARRRHRPPADRNTPSCPKRLPPRFLPPPRKRVPHRRASGPRGLPARGASRGRTRWSLPPRPGATGALICGTATPSRRPEPQGVTSSAAQSKKPPVIPHGGLPWHTSKAGDDLPLFPATPARAGIHLFLDRGPVSWLPFSLLPRLPETLPGPSGLPAVSSRSQWRGRAGLSPASRSSAILTLCICPCPEGDRGRECPFPFSRSAPHQNLHFGEERRIHLTCGFLARFPSPLFEKERRLLWFFLFFLSIPQAPLLSSRTSHHPQEQRRKKAHTRANTPTKTKKEQ